MNPYFGIARRVESHSRLIYSLYNRVDLFRIWQTGKLGVPLADLVTDIDADGKAARNDGQHANFLDCQESESLMVPAHICWCGD